MGDSATIEREEVGLEDEGGAPLTVPLAEMQLLGCIVRWPDLIDEVVGLVGASDFSDNFHRAIFEGLAKAMGFATPAQIVEWLGGKDAVIYDRTAQQYVGHLIGTAADLSPAEAVELAQLIQECSERRAGAGDTFLANEPFRSKMGLVTWAERNDKGEDAYDELVEGIIPEKELVLIIGATQAGKSYLARHLCYCLARGVPFMGRRILDPVPVVWCAYEGGRGVKARDQAYAKAFDYRGDMLLATLAKPIDLWSKDLNVEELITEIEGVSRHEFGGRNPGAIVIDTHNAATPGASEIDSGEVSKIRDRYRRLATVFGCTVIIIGHTNSLGKMRGNEQLANNVETVLIVTRKPKNPTAKVPEIQRDDDNREIRSVELWKQREGATGHLFDFVLPSIDTDIVNKFGKVRTACVVSPPNLSSGPPEPEAQRNPSTRHGVKLNSDITFNFFKTFWKQLQEFGEPAPAQLNLPRGSRVVAHAVIKKAYRETCDPDMKENTIKSQFKRAVGQLMRLDLIGLNSQAMVFWWTGKAVVGIRDTEPRRKIDDAPDFTTMNDWPDEV